MDVVWFELVGRIFHRGGGLTPERPGRREFEGGGTTTTSYGDLSVAQNDGRGEWKLGRVCGARLDHRNMHAELWTAPDGAPGPVYAETLLEEVCVAGARAVLSPLVRSGRLVYWRNSAKICW